jgi:hypothetical protein
VVGFDYGDGPLVFEDDRTLTMDWKEVEASTGVLVCNIGTEDLKIQRLRATLTGFKFKVGEDSVKDELVLKTPADIEPLSGKGNTHLKAGSCANVRIEEAPGASPPAEGTYEGLLTVSGSGIDMIRRTVQVSAPKPDTKPTPKESAVGDVAVSAELADWKVEFDLPLKVKEGVKLNNLNLPSAGTRIGTLYSDGHLGYVYVRGAPDAPARGVLLLPVEVTDLKAPGTYKGPVSLTGNDEEKINLTVTVEEAAEPVVTEINVTGKRNVPWGNSLSFAEDIKFQFDVPPGGQSPKFFQSGTHVGWVVGPNQKAGAVHTINCSDTSVDTVSETNGGDGTDRSLEPVCLTVEDLNTPGKYTGKVDVTDNNKDDDGLSLTVTVTDHEMWVILAAMLSLTLGFIFTVWIPQSLRPYLNLAGRIGKARQKVQELNDNRACFTPENGNQEQITVDVRGFGWPKEQIRLYSPTSNGEIELGTVNPPDDLNGDWDWDYSFNIPRELLTTGSHEIHAATVTNCTCKMHPWTIPCPRLEEGFWKRLAAWPRPSTREPMGPSGPTFEVTTKRKLRWYRIQADTYIRSVWTALDSYNKLQLVWDTSDEKHKDLEKQIIQAEEDLQRFEKFDDELEKLNSQLEEFRSILGIMNEKLGMQPDKKPKLIDSIGSQLKGTTVPIAYPDSKMQARLDSWAGLGKLMEQWQNLAGQIVQHQDWITKLRDKINQASLKVADKEHDLRLIKYAEAKLQEVKYEMYAAASSEQLLAMRTSSELDLVYRRLAFLGGKYDVWEEPPEPWPPEEPLMEWTPPPIIAKVIPEIEQAPPGLIIGTRRALDLVSIGFALFVAVFTIFQSKYVDNKAFGTTVDYLTVILISGSAPLISTGLVEAIKRFFSHR